MRRLAKKWLAVPEPPWSEAGNALEVMDNLIGDYVRKYDRRRYGPLTLCEYEAGRNRRATDKPEKEA